ncbi:MAG: hypothetical protein XD63_0775 [Thermoanaerobacterales bacterium 50_218]|nr:MAG: hypothetical protein XD63_0775 [Thermoanaerobacterales bacterium 50_218]HAA90370.1 hypothetical protein [Peptococcaceae bacterium]
MPKKNCTLFLVLVFSTLVTGLEVFSSSRAFPSNPFMIIDKFYQAFSETNWDYVRSLTSPAMFAYLEKSGLLERWETIKREDPTIRFGMFLILDSHLDLLKGEAWALGRVCWESKKRVLPEYHETIFLRLLEGQWKIVQIRIQPSVETAIQLYQSIQNADWKRFRELLTDRYWQRLHSRGVIEALKKDRSENKTGVYVIFLVRDFAETESRAWVQGDVIWNPLSQWQKEDSITIFLVREPEGWKVDFIRGHWENGK